MGKFRPGNIITFMSEETKEYLSIDNDGNAILVPLKTEWEHFKLHRLRDNKYIMESGHKLILNSTQNFGDKSKMKFWRALTKNYLISNDHHNGIDIIKIKPDIVALRNFNGEFLSVENPKSNSEKKKLEKQNMLKMHAGLQ